MSGVNKAIVLGHVGKNPDIRQMPNGGKVASFTLATSERWRDKATGERKERTDWHRIVVFNEALVGVVERYVKKGSKLYVEGAMKTRQWTDQANVTRYVTEIVLSGFHSALTLLDRAPGGPPPSDDAADYGAERTVAPGGAVPMANKNTDMDDEIPF